jgi:hypothetical protein
MSSSLATSGGATFSECGTYRYTLTRTIVRGGQAGTVAFVGLNPSTATAEEDDPTIRRCIRFAHDWGFDRLLMLNLYAYRSTDPKRLAQVKDPVGPHNDAVLAGYCDAADLVVAAWGAFPFAQARASRVVSGSNRLIEDYTVLGLTAKGDPRHPLYMRADCRPLNPKTMEAVL